MAQQGLDVGLGWLYRAARAPLRTPQFQTEPCRYARLVAPIIERIDSGCVSNPMRVLIRLTAPSGIVNLTYGELVNKTTGNNMRTILIALLMALMNKVGKL